jgi:hypothetical protein
MHGVGSGVGTFGSGGGANGSGVVQMGGGSGWQTAEGAKGPPQPRPNGANALL